MKNNRSLPPTSQRKEPKRIPSLDGLRAVSVFLVVALHTLQRYSLSHHVSFVWYALFNGGDGVFIFFEISGFLITSLLLEEYNKRGSISLRGFYLRRVFRILPPLYFYIGVILLLGYMGRVVLNRNDIVSAVFFFHNFARGTTMWSMEHLWSISVEEQFYLWWPFVLVVCLRTKGDASRFRAAMIPLAILVVSPVARVLLSSERTHPLLRQIGTTDLNLDFLMFGCVVALLQKTAYFELLYKWATRRWWLPLAVMGLCSLLSSRFAHYFDLPIGYSINGAAIAMFLLWCTRNPESFAGRVLNFAPIVKIGVLSYSIYLWQTLFLHNGNEQVFGRLALIGKFPLNWLGFLLAASFSYYVIEQPALRLRSRLVKASHSYSQKPNEQTASAR